jgi:hypothetical protein
LHQDLKTPQQPYECQPQSVRPSPSSCTAMMSYHESPLTSSAPDSRGRWLYTNLPFQVNK